MIVILVSIKVISLSIAVSCNLLWLFLTARGAKLRRSANILSFDRYLENFENCFSFILTFLFFYFQIDSNLKTSRIAFLIFCKYQEIFWVPIHVLWLDRIIADNFLICIILGQNNVNLHTFSALPCILSFRKLTESFHEAHDQIMEPQKFVLRILTRHRAIMSS